MFRVSEFGESLSVDFKDNIVSFWIDSHGEATSFEFDLSFDDEMKNFRDLIKYLNGVKKTQKDSK